MRPLPSVRGVSQQLVVVGAQLVGGEGAAEHINAVAVARRADFDVVDLTAADLSYAPTYPSIYELTLPSTPTATPTIAGSLPTRT